MSDASASPCLMSCIALLMALPPKIICIIINLSLDDMANCKDILGLINLRNVIKFVWGKETDSPTRHSAIVVKFEENPEIVIEFFALNTNKLSTLRSFHYVQSITQLALPYDIRSIPSNTKIFRFNKEGKFDVLESILKFDIVNKVEKERASRLILDLQLIEMGRYHAINNNAELL